MKPLMTDAVSADADIVSADASAASADADLKPGRSARLDQNRDAAAPASSTVQAWSIVLRIVAERK
jgi:hypothetical protein